MWLNVWLVLAGAGEVSGGIAVAAFSFQERAQAVVGFGQVGLLRKSRQVVLLRGRRVAARPTDLGQTQAGRDEVWPALDERQQPAFAAGVVPLMKAIEGGLQLHGVALLLERMHRGCFAGLTVVGHPRLRGKVLAPARTAGQQ
jgi:hypothetical protein